MLSICLPWYRKKSYKTFLAQRNVNGKSPSSNKKKACCNKRLNYEIINSNRQECCANGDVANIGQCWFMISAMTHFLWFIMIMNHIFTSISFIPTVNTKISKHIQGMYLSCPISSPIFLFDFVSKIVDKYSDTPE